MNIRLSGIKIISFAIPAAKAATANYCRNSGASRGIRESVRGFLTNCGNCRGEANSNRDTVKRPPFATFKGGNDPGLRGPKGTSKLRRRLADNTWTSVPMDDKIIWVDCEVSVHTDANAKLLIVESMQLAVLKKLQVKLIKRDFVDFFQMTGLNPAVDQLIEIGVIITDAELNVIATQDSIVFYAEDSVLDAMDPWCIKHHGDSGLIAAVKNSKITHEIADENLLKFLQQYTTQGECPMAGNSIGQDRGFIRRQLPKFHSHIHYRDIDVSSIKELVRRWHPEVFDAAPRKKRAHRVLDDIKDSIEELQYYRSTVFSSRINATARDKKQ